jgi:hypothetical protein
LFPLAHIFRGGAKLNAKGKFVYLNFALFWPSLKLKENLFFLEAEFLGPSLKLKDEYLNSKIFLPSLQLECKFVYHNFIFDKFKA